MTSRPGFKRSRWGAIINALLAVVAIASIGVTAAVTSSIRRRQPPPPEPLTNRELEVALRRGEISPDALAALGLTGAQTTALITRARDSLSPGIEAYRAAHNAVAPARVQSDRLERLVRSGLGSEQDVTGLATAKASLDSALAAMENLHGGVRTAAAGDTLAPGQSTMLQSMLANKAWNRLPIEYRFRPQPTEVQWVALREALFEQRSAAAENRAIDEAAQTTLNAWAAIQDVATARDNFQQRLPEVTAAWNEALD